MTNRGIVEEEEEEEEEEEHMEINLEPVAAAYGLDLRRLRRCLLPVETRARLETLEARAEAARIAYLALQEALADRQIEHGAVQRAYEERRRDMRGVPPDERAAVGHLLAILDSEMARMRTALEAASSKAADAGRLATAVREHLLGRVAPYGVAREPANTIRYSERATP
jgi:hypothetical protein